MDDPNVPIKYIDRTRHYYRALGYTRDYIWAAFDDVPFSELAKPLSKTRIALVTTASPIDFDGVKRVWSGPVSPPPPKLFTNNVAWDKDSTHTNDRASFLPIEAAAELASEGLFERPDAAFPWRPNRVQPAQNAYRRRAANPCACSRRWSGRGSSMSSLSDLPSNR